MNENLARDLENLRTDFKKKAVREAEEQIAAVMEWRDPAAIGLLLCLLHDDAEYHVLMFSLIHSAEALGTEGYESELLKVLPEVHSNSPDWASVLIMRVLNHAESLSALPDFLRKASPESREAFREVCSRISLEAPEFSTRISSLLAGLD